MYNFSSSNGQITIEEALHINGMMIKVGWRWKIQADWVFCDSDGLRYNIFNIPCMG